MAKSIGRGLRHGALLAEFPGAFLQGVDGARIPLTPDDYRRVREFLLAEPERAVADDERITTGEAARILGVSQRTLTRMLDAGMIPYTRMGERSYRFLRLSDVTDYKRRRDEATSKALDEMRSIADEDGACDIDYSDYLSRFDK